MNGSLYKLAFNPITDLAPVILLAQMPYLLAVNPSLPLKTARDVVSQAKAQPGKLIFASSGAGTSSHLAMELFRTMAGIELLHVPFKGGGPAVTSVMGGEVQGIFNVITGTLPYARNGKLRALAVSSARCAEVAPGYDMISWYNVFAPARTPRPIIDRLNGEINRMLQTPEVRERFQTLGVTPLGGTPETLGKYLAFETVRWAKLIKEAGIQIK